MAYADFETFSLTIQPARMNNKRTLRLQYMFFDLAAAFIVWVLFMYFRQIVNDGKLFENVQIYIPKYNFFSSLVVYPFFCLFINWLSGIYVQPLNHQKTTILLSTFASSIIISITIFFFLLLDDVVVSYEFYYYSLLVLLGLHFTITFVFRLAIILTVKRNYRKKIWTTNTIIIGTGSNAQKVSKELQRKAERQTLIGFISEKNRKTATPVPELTLGNMSQIAMIIEKYHIEEAIIALDENDEHALFSIINALFRFNIEIHFTARVYEILTGSAKVQEPGISPLVSITSPSMSDWQISMKRFIDVTVSTVALVILSPLFIFFAIRIKTDSKGTVFYRQERIGRYGRPFDILKFRTMYKGAENGIPRLSSSKDNRVTAAGRILRKYRLDELPQFWNVLKGEMSLVGPRPERTYYINQIIETAPYYCLIYKIRPGLTSWGPIRIGYSDTIEKMVERLNYDIIYMDNMSLLIDLKIILQTAEVIFKGKGM